MSGGIWISKDGFRATKWSPEDRAYIDKEIRDIFHELRIGCHIEEGTTLTDIFRAVDAHPQLVYLIGEYSWCNVKAFNDEIMKPPIEKSDMVAIELSRHVELWEHGLEDSLDVHGIGLNDEGVMVDNWALDFTLVNNIAHLPVRLAPKATIRDLRDYETGKDTNLGELETSYTLLEVLTELYFEFSFHGSPEEVIDAGVHILGLVKEVKDGVEEGSITLTPFEPEKDRVN